jgi:hypothetical protein
MLESSLGVTPPKTKDVNTMAADSYQNFIDGFDDFSRWAPQTQADYTSYYLQTVEGAESVSSKAIMQKMRDAALREYSRLPQYLSENAGSRNGKYIKSPKGGYRLVKGTFEDIDRAVKGEPQKVQVSMRLIELVEKVPDGSEKDFLEEAVKCFRIGATRATIIMVWIVAMEHLQKYIYANKLQGFQAAQSAHTDKKMKRVINYDDFSDLKETRFIELARLSGAISNDVRKLLDEKLGVRNSAAHPSGVNISSHKATEFALDLIDNILLKYS